MKKEYLVFGGLLALMLLLFAYETSSIYWHRGMGGMHWGMEPWMWKMHSRMMGPTIAGFTWTFWIFLILFAVFVYLLFYKREDPVEVLKRRYARGEITREEYLQAFKDLKEK